MRQVYLSSESITLIIPETFCDRVRIRIKNMLGKGKLVSNYSAPFGESLVIIGKQNENQTQSS